ncbi:MAG: ATPase, partial [Gemmatimonadota bacterium]
MARNSRSPEQLRASLRAIDSKGYGAYKQIAGGYDFGDLVLHIDYVQGDPFAAPSRLRAVFPREVTQLPEELLQPVARRRATADCLNRRTWDALNKISRPRGSGKSGLVRILKPRQQILERTSLKIDKAGSAIVRFYAGLPASGRRILGQAAIDLLLSAIPDALRGVLAPAARDLESLRRHALLTEDSTALRAQLEEKQLVAFIADEAILPRRSGIDDRPLPAAQA